MADIAGLAPEHRELLRDIHDGKDVNIQDPFLDILHKMKLIRFAGPGYLVLTDEGDDIYTEIMKSGDGPEALKEMFR